MNELLQKLDANGIIDLKFDQKVIDGAKDVANFAKRNARWGLAALALGTAGVALDVSYSVGVLDGRTAQVRSVSDVGLNFLGVSVRGDNGVSTLRPEQDHNTIFNIIGVPNQVLGSSMEKSANETTPAPGDVVHTNTLGVEQTKHWIADPGQRTLTVLGVVEKDGKLVFEQQQVAKDLQDIQNGAAWFLTPDNQRPFDHENYPFPVHGGAFSLVTGAGMDVKFQNTGVEIHLGAEPGTTWFLLVRGKPEDGLLDTDPNDKMTVTNFNTGFVTGTLLPRGQYVSQDYIEQNVAAAQGEYNAQNAIDCGTNGCSKARFALYDEQTGGYVEMFKSSPDAKWALVDTNIKE